MSLECTGSYLFFTVAVFLILLLSYYVCGLPRWLSGKESASNAGHKGSIPGMGRVPGVGNGNPLQDSCLEKPMIRGAWQGIVHGVAKESNTTL